MAMQSREASCGTNNKSFVTANSWKISPPVPIGMRSPGTREDMRKVRERNDKRLPFVGGSESLRVPESFSARLHLES